MSGKCFLQHFYRPWPEKFVFDFVFINPFVIDMLRAKMKFIGIQIIY